jgi:hypothetical protein
VVRALIVRKPRNGIDYIRTDCGMSRLSLSSAFETGLCFLMPPQI